MRNINDTYRFVGKRNKEWLDNQPANSIHEVNVLAGAGYYTGRSVGIFIGALSVILGNIIGFIIAGGM